jgi:hypothetical protein
LGLTFIRCFFEAQADNSDNSYLYRIYDGSGLSGIVSYGQRALESMYSLFWNPSVDDIDPLSNKPVLDGKTSNVVEKDVTLF